MIPSLTPIDLGLPAKFSSWRSGQLRALDKSLSSSKRFIAHSMPVGEGKSLYYVAHSLFINPPLNSMRKKGRTCILTSSKNLQTQLLTDFSPIGLTDMRGRNNYPCQIKEARNCEEGQHFRRCSPAECKYEQARARMLAADLVSTNYRYFMLSHLYGRGMGEFDLLVCDEAHDAADEVCDAIAVEVEYREATKIGLRLPGEDAEMEEWFEWGRKVAVQASVEIMKLKEQAEAEKTDEGHVSHATAKDLHFWNTVIAKAQAIAAAEGTGRWIHSRTGRGRRVEPVWAYYHAPRVLFKDIPKVVLTSATMVKKTLQLLGVADDEVEFLEYPSSFPPKRSPVYMFGPSFGRSQLRIDHKTPQEYLDIWAGYIDNVIGARLDRKGIIHTVSYERARYIQSVSSHAAYMIVPGSARETPEALERFRLSPPPSILVSPSITTGYDFPFDACEYNLIVKVPFLDTRTPIILARQEEDPEYAPYVTAQTITQAFGRSMRDEWDQSECFIMDGHFVWFIKKFHHLFTYWFHRLVTRPSGLPQPPKALVASGNHYSATLATK